VRWIKRFSVGTDLELVVITIFPHCDELGTPVDPAEGVRGRASDRRHRSGEGTRNVPKVSSSILVRGLPSGNTPHLR
jgi:hypothetical protein